MLWLTGCLISRDRLSPETYWRGQRSSKLPCIEMESYVSRFNVSLKSPDYVHKPHLMKRKESRSGLRAHELCESRGGRPGLSSLISLRFLWT